DAAKLLQLEPFRDIEVRLDRQAKRAFHPESGHAAAAGTETAKPAAAAEVIAKDPTVAGKSTFSFVDTSKPLVRLLFAVVFGAVRDISLVAYNISTSTVITITTSRVQNQPVYIRDRDGTFRVASKVERLRKRHTRPKFFL
ncbi:hypothetical protein HK405_001888, partial [Cladochytrium tenue]